MKKISRWLIYLQSHLFNIYSFQRFSALLSDFFVARLALVLQCDSSGMAPGIWSFLEPCSELYLLLEQFSSSVSTLHAEIFFKWERITKLESSSQICSFLFSFLFLIFGFFCTCAEHALAQVLYLSLAFFFFCVMRYISMGLIIFCFWSGEGEAHSSRT